MPSTTKKSRKKNKKIVIIGNSMLRYQRPKFLSTNNNFVNVRFHPGATAEDIVDFIKPVIRKKPEKTNLPFKKQAIPFELTLKKEKWLVISIYRSPLESSNCFLGSSTNMIDFFSSSCDNFIVMGDFNSKPTDSIMRGFMEANGFVNLTNRKYSFKHSNSIETGISDHDQMVECSFKN